MRFSLFRFRGFGNECARMPCLRFPYASFILLVALGGLFAGCGRDSGSPPDAQVQALQMSSELDRTKKKLAAVAKESEAKDDAVLLAREEATKMKKDVAER